MAAGRLDRRVRAHRLYAPISKHVDGLAAQTVGNTCTWRHRNGSGVDALAERTAGKTDTEHRHSGSDADGLQEPPAERTGNVHRCISWNPSP